MSPTLTVRTMIDALEAVLAEHGGDLGLALEEECLGHVATFAPSVEVSDSSGAWIAYLSADGIYATEGEFSGALLDDSH